MKSKTLASVLSTLFLGALVAGCATTSASPESSAPAAEQTAKACSCCKGPCKCGHKATEAPQATGDGASASAPEEGTQRRACAMSACACGKPKS
jgi:hypothetical protein